MSVRAATGGPCPPRYGDVVVADRSPIKVVPANQATSDWTVIPADWRELRVRWEYSHAVNAVLAFAALCSVTLPALLARE